MAAHPRDGPVSAGCFRHARPQIVETLCLVEGVKFSGITDELIREGLLVQTPKDVLGRSEERSNLKTVVFCMAIVVFGFSEFQYFSLGWSEEPQVTEASAQLD